MLTAPLVVEDTSILYLQLRKLSRREAKHLPRMLPQQVLPQQLSLVQGSAHLTSFLAMVSLVFCIAHVFPLPSPYLFFGNSILDPKLLESVNKAEAGCSGHGVPRKRLRTGDENRCPPIPVSVREGNAC